MKSLDSLTQNVALVNRKEFGSRFKSDPTAFTRDSLATITLQKYKPNYLKYVSIIRKTASRSFSEMYYKDGWNAYIDGKPK
jgi:hypothetical protein